MKKTATSTDIMLVKASGESINRSHQILLPTHHRHRTTL